VDLDDTRAWFEECLRAFAACGRGEPGALPALLEHYAVPLLLTTDAATLMLATEAEVAAAMSEQLGGLRAAGYHASEAVESETVVVNATSVLHTALVSRLRDDGSELGRLRATYLIVAGSSGRRISALLVHGD
jgi:uncharacterized NTF2-like protein DUF6841